MSISSYRMGLFGLVTWVAACGTEPIPTQEVPVPTPDEPSAYVAPLSVGILPGGVEARMTGEGVTAHLVIMPGAGPMHLEGEDVNFDSTSVPHGGDQ
jgi:hypothetical protein